jgi:two-component system, chemotaxis family, response regulator WspF
LRIAIVNDLALAVEVLRRVVLSHAGYEIAWIAKNGAAAVNECRKDLPDLILMDLIMPVMDGVEATRRIMQETPCAILVVTATVTGHSDKVFEAMGCGALDVVCTPVLGPGSRIEGGNELLDKVDRISRLIPKQSPTLFKPRPIGALPITGRLPPLVAVGASAGGPKAVAQILGQLPGDFRGSLVIVQHVNAGFAASLVEWLGSQTALRVELAQNGARPAPGSVLIAGGDRHLVMTPEFCLTYSPQPVESPYRPSIDVFFSSVGEHWPSKALAILLTGMGTDGARGLLCLRRAGWRTIAQDKASCAVYGMPRAAVELDAASDVLPLPEIPAAIMGFASRG